MIRNSRCATYLLTVFCLLASVFSVAAQKNSSANLAAGNPAIETNGKLPLNEVENIVRTFSAKESQYRQAFNNYSFTRDAVIQTIGLGGQVTGEYHRNSRFTFDDNSVRYEKILRFPLSTLQELSITAEDLDDLAGVNPFALEPSKINAYRFSYVGKEQIDELNLFVFDVAPKVMPDPKRVSERYFQGRIWVDDKDFFIVKSKGKGIPEGEQRFPIFETYRENIGGKFWFPTYSYADEDLVFKQGNVVHIRVLVKYSDFKPAKAKVTIRDIDDVDDQSPNSEPPPPPAVKPATPPQ